jgi:hypothetical protein
MGVEAAVFVGGCVCVFFSGSGILFGVFLVLCWAWNWEREFVVVVVVVVVVLQMRS